MKSWEEVRANFDPPLQVGETDLSDEELVEIAHITFQGEPFINGLSTIDLYGRPLDDGYQVFTSNCQYFSVSFHHRVKNNATLDDHGNNFPHTPVEVNHLMDVWRVGKGIVRIASDAVFGSGNLYSIPSITEEGLKTCSGDERTLNGFQELKKREIMETITLHGAVRILCMVTGVYCSPVEERGNGDPILETEDYDMLHAHCDGFCRLAISSKGLDMVIIVKSFNY